LQELLCPEESAIEEWFYACGPACGYSAENDCIGGSDRAVGGMGKVNVPKCFPVLRLRYREQ